MKFHEDILKGYKVIERTRFCHRNATYKVQRDITQKYISKSYGSCALHRRPILINISIKFHEDILNGFKVIERSRFCHRNCYLQSSKAHNSKNIYPRVMVLALCTSSNIG